MIQIQIVDLYKIPMVILHQLYYHIKLEKKNIKYVIQVQYKYDKTFLHNKIVFFMDIIAHN